VLDSFLFYGKGGCRRANEQNLVQNSGRSREEVKEINAKGGINSGIARRKRKALRDSMNMLLEMQPTAKEFNKLIEAGFEPEEIDNSLMVTLALFNQSKKGDVQAIKELRNLIGEDKPDSDAEYTKVDELIASIDRLAKS
jgi:hypothetical protein